MSFDTRTVTLRARTMLGPAIEVDRDAGVIRNVAVITAGVTKISGNGAQPFDVDATTLQQVADAINSNEIGIKSRMTHPEVAGLGDDINLRVGYVRNARVDGEAVRADVHFHDPSGTAALTLMSIAEQDPKSAGLSLVDLDAAVEPNDLADTGMVLRVVDIDAIDWVGEPAANPAGMLSAKPSANVQHNDQITLQKGAAMNEKQMEFLREIGLPEGATEQQISEFVDALSDEQRAQLEALREVPQPRQDEEAVAAAGDKDEDMPAMAASAKPDKGREGVALSQEQFDERIRAARKAERQREREIRNIALRCGYDENWIAKHVDNETDIQEVRRVALANLKREPHDMPTHRIQVGADHNRDTLNQAVQDAIMLRAGVRNFVEFDAENGVALSADNRPITRRAHERANDFRGHSIIEMGRRFLVALGYRDADRMNKAQLASLLMSRTQLEAKLSGTFLAQSTGDFPFLLADSMGKVLRGEYALAPHTWSRWTRRTTAPDFKDIKAIQLSEAADLVVIPEGDDYEYASLSESRETYALETQGKGLKFTRQMLINDDLSAFDRVPRLMGRAAARAVESAVISILTTNAALSDGIALFNASHNNVTTGALSVTALGEARAAMRKQTALGSDDPLELTPRYLIVPESISTDAQQLIASTVDPAKSNATPNPFSNQMEVLPSARLDTDDTAQYYLAADPSEIDTVEVAFLEGEETPVVEEESAFDNDVRKVKVRHTFKPKAIDFRGLVRSSGA